MSDEKKDPGTGGSVSRREFLARTTLSVATAGSVLPRLSAAASADLPRRVLGGTGLSVSILAFGCGSRFLMYEDETVAHGVLEDALALGLNYFDTAVDYGAGESETRVGRFLKTRRSEVHVATKVPERARTRDGALREVEGSLKRLQTDHVEVLHLHSLGDASDLARIEAADGALRALYELREQKVARFVGMTSHTDGHVMATAIERHDLDCVQMAMNPARAAAFEEKALPAARAKNLGVLLMKATAQEELLGPGGARADELLRYAWSLPVATAVVGMPKPEHLKANVAAARAFAPMSASEQDALRQRLAPKQAALEGFFADHQDIVRA